MMMTVYSPLARCRVRRDPTLTAIAEKHGKTASQAALCWLIEQDCVAVIPKASERAHMIENLAALDFALTSEDHAVIGRLGGREGRLNDVRERRPVWDKAYRKGATGRGALCTGG